MVRHVHELRAGRSDRSAGLRLRAARARRRRPKRSRPRRALIVEGILIYTDPALRKLMDVKVYVDTDDDTRFIRRLQRDIAERGRTVAVGDRAVPCRPSSRCTSSSSSRASATPTSSSRWAATTLVAIDMLLTLIRGLTSGSAFLRSAYFTLHLVQHHRLVGEVLQLDGAVLRLGDLRVDRRLAVAVAVLVDLQLDQRERIVDRARTVRRLPRSRCSDRSSGRSCGRRRPRDAAARSAGRSAASPAC